jgi:hypothetical protein
VGPKLQFSFSTTRLGTGQYESGHYVYTPDYVTASLVVRLTSEDTSKATVPDSVVIPNGSYYAYFTTSAKAPATVSLFATATGYTPDTASVIVTSPRVTACCSSTRNNFGPPVGLTVYSTDSLGSGHYRSTPLVVSLASSDTNVVRVDSSSVTIAAGQAYNNIARVIIVGLGTARVVVSAAGHRPDSVTYTVQTPKLNFNFSSSRVGRRQYFGSTDFYVYTPDYRTSPLTVTITQKRPAVDSLTATSLTIPTSSYYQYFGAFGLSFGTDTLIASATGYNPDTAFIVVTTPKFTTGGLPGSATTTSPPSNVIVYATDSVGSGHYTMDSVLVKAVSSDTNVIRPAARGFYIPKGQYYVYTSVNYIGPGTANITYSDSLGTGYLPVTTNTVTVTGPSLTFSTTSLRYGMRQRSGTSDVYVYTPNNVATPLTVNLVSTDTHVVKVPASVTIPAGSYYAYFTVTAQDTLGTIQVQATATGYNPPTPISVQVTQPKFVISSSSSIYTTSGPQTLTIYAADANGTGHYVTENVVVTLASSAGGVATTDSTTVTIPAGQYYTQAARWIPVSPGTAQLSFSDERAVFYKYNTATFNVAVSTPPLSLNWSSMSLGLGQYVDQYVQTPNYQPSNLTVALSHVGAARTTVPASVTIPAGNYYAYFRVTGAARGTDSLIATATSGATHFPDTAYTAVDSGRVDPIGGWPSSLQVGDSTLITLYARDPSTGTRYVAAATTFTLAPNSNIRFVAQGGTTPITNVTIPADAYYVQFYVRALSAGTGSVTITHPNYRTHIQNVTVNP